MRERTSASHGPDDGAVSDGGGAIDPFAGGGDNGYRGGNPGDPPSVETDATAAETSRIRRLSK